MNKALMNKALMSIFTSLWLFSASGRLRKSGEGGDFLSKTKQETEM
jgi:hypothetical protein